MQTLNKNCRRLTHLNLSQCKQILSPKVQNLFLHKQLRVLNLSFVETIGDDAFCLWSSPSPLQILNLCKSRITDSSMQKLTRMKELLEIHLQWCSGITDVGICTLVQSCPKLRVIDLKSCLVTDAALCAIAELCPDLRDLDLSWCFAVTNDGLRKLIPNSDHPRVLEKLSLVWCPQITDATLEILCELPSLQRVSLSGCSAVTTEGLSLLEMHGITVIS